MKHLLPWLLISSLTSCALMQDPALPVAGGELPAETPAVVVAEAEKPALRPLPDDSVYPLLLAELALRDRQYTEALRIFLQQAEILRDPQVAASAARLAHFTNAEKEAFAAAKLWLELEADSTEARSIAAAALARTARPLEALDYMEQILQRGESGNFTSLAASALALPAAAQSEMINRLETLEQRYPGESSLKTARSLLLQYNQRADEALSVVREVLRDDPEDMHGLLIETQLLQQLGLQDEAIERLRYAVGAHPGNRRLRLQLARLLTRSDMAAALSHYSVLRNQNPEDADITLALALVNRELGHIDDARRDLRILRQRDSHKDRAHYFLATLAEGERQWQQAIDHYAQVSPGNEFRASVVRLVTLTRQHKSLQEARDVLSELSEKHPGQSLALTLIESDMLFQQRAYADGHALLSGALAENPGNTDLLYARSLFSERLRQVDLLEQDLRSILSREPNNAAALNALGYSLATLTDRLDEARDLVRRALEFRPEDPAIQDSYGWIAYRLGEMDTAREFLEKAFNASGDHEIAAHLGELYWVLGEKDNALRVWRKGLENDPKSPVIGDTLKRLKIADDML